MRTKKNGKGKKPAKVTAEMIATAKKAGIVVYPVAVIKRALKCTWHQAVAVCRALRGGKR
jgi:hypothetical protein